ncbi:zinc-regulated transporter 2 [Dendroctonus ponderosae]|uniref:Uncharacterized protein n=1 Tax=Dendroctonus ponderosae TaxID=77166 RepID=U4U6D4_DENPD|nr:zinc-regulated transporter 2 [Dendroctonus ponderosae]ERL88642.1 hypothetical protein D910_06026 [Dendroctonus ponderosae]
MDLTSTKICVGILFGFWRFFWGILPVKLDRYLRKWEEASSDSKTFINEKRHQQVTCYVALTQSFGGGVLFATCFLHMMKELFISVEEIKAKWELSNNEYPISQVIIAFGFFSIYFLEEFTHWMVNKGKKRQCTKMYVGKVANVITKQKAPVPTSAKSTQSLRSSKVSPMKTIATIEEWELNQKNKPESEFEFDEELSPTTEKEEKPGNFLTSPCTSEKSMNRTYSGRSRHSIKEEINRANIALIQEEQLSLTDEETMKDQEQLMRCVLTIAALSLHTLLEGLSIGIQKFKYEIWYLFIAVSIHSASILFCMGVELILAQTRIRFIVLQMAALALASPVGILLGLLVSGESSMKTFGMSVAGVIVEGFSAGTILYITFFEVLNRERERRVYRLRRGLCIVGGFVIMALLQYSETRSDKHKILQYNNYNKTVS